MKKKRNWLEKFQDFWWDELTPIQRKHLWAVLTATRGPDREPRNATRIKWRTTARIRYFLLGKKARQMDYGFISKGPESPITWKTVYKSVGDHFGRHAELATEELKTVVKQSEMKDLLEIFEPDKVEKPGGVQ